MAVYWLDFFSGGVPALDYFLLQVKELRKIADASPEEMGINVTAELCVIGLAAYFEAFCKNEFAAVINICPETLDGFALKRECKVSARSLLHIVSGPRSRLGFLIAEEYDFGSAKTINGLFQDLLSITPFSKGGAKRYGEFLNDRNLLVHHGGIYTAKYSGQRFERRSIGPRVYFDSLVVKKTNVHQWSDFITDEATKMGNATRTALSAFVVSNKIRCDAKKKMAIQALGV